MDVRIPRLGLTMESAVLVRWLVREGDALAKEQAIADIATDKVEYTITSPGGGRLEIIREPSTDELAVGTLIARVIQR